MKKTILTLVAALFAAWAMAEENPVAPLQYDMTFKGRGETTTVQTVTVENLTLGTFLELSGSDVLRLTNAPSQNGVEEVSAVKVHSVIYPNPSFGAASLVFANRAAGNVQITVTDLSGKTVTSSSFNIESGKQTAVLPAMPQGQYIVTLRGKGINESVKWLSAGGGTGGAIRLEGNELAIAASAAETKSQSPVASAAIGYFPVVAPQMRAANANIVEMEYHDGELLRFTGVSGNRTTIVMNIPTLSHDITFDFYACTDASGYHYTIVNAGGMLWMAEDLRPVTQGMLVVNDAATWLDNFTDNDPKVAYYNFDNSKSTQSGYYNYAGALAALPAGWNLPTQGEVDYMLNTLGGYTPGAAKLKSRQTGDWSIQPTGLDSVSFGGVAAGMLNEQGAFSGKGSLMRYWTKALRSANPNYWGVQSTAAQNVPNGQTVEAPAFTGLCVRGCRPAPSAYADVMALFPREELRSAKAFSSGPIGGMYTVVKEKQKLFVDIQNSTNGVVRYDYKGNAYVESVIHNKTNDKLRKSTPQNNVEGRQNLIRAIWNGGGNVLGANTPEGSNKISIEIFADSLGGYARVDSIVLPTIFEMPPAPSMPIVSNTGNAQSNAWISGIDYYTSFLQVFKTQEFYSKRFQVASADFNLDGVGDIVVMVGNRVEVYSGVSPYARLNAKTFASNNLRIAVGDGDGDGEPDIAVVYPLNSDNAQVELYSGGNLSLAAPSAHVTVPAGNNNDIKIGEVTGNGKNDIVVYTRKDYALNGQLRVLEYNTSVTGAINQVASYPIDNYKEGQICNSNVTLYRPRGANYPADIAVGYHVYRYNANKGYFEGIIPSFFGANGTSRYEGNRYIPADLITAGNINGDEDGKEELIYTVALSRADGSIYSMSGTKTYCTANYTIPATTYYRKSEDTNPEATILKASYTYMRFSLYGTVKNATEIGSTGVYIYTDYQITHALAYGATSPTAANLNVPASWGTMSAARSIEPAKIFKYIDHTTTMSEPRIYALLAAPPFYKYKPDGTPYEYGNFSSMGTSWGKSQVTGTGAANESSYSVSAIFGFNLEINAPIVGTKLGEIDFTTKLESEWTNSTEKEYTTEQSIEFTAPQNDAVVLSASFFDTYTYEIVQSGNPEEVGGLLNISLPAQQRTMGLTLNDYERLTADDPTVPQLRKLFTHKVGYPFTYPNEKTQLASNVNGTATLWAMPFAGQEFVSIGSGTDVNRSITLTEETVSTAAFSFGMEMELVATVGTVKAGVGFGYNNTNSSSHKEGVGHSIAGNVSGLQRIGEYGLSDFRWTVGWYQYRLGGQTFPVVNYVVKE